MLRTRVAGRRGPYVWLQRRGSGPRVIFQRVAEPKRGKNRVHVDLFTADPEREANRLVSVGATRLETHEGSHKVIVLNDPQGNVFCVIEHGPSRS